MSKLSLPPLIFGTSALGNLYEAVPFATKVRIVEQIIQHNRQGAILDCAGKYGAGLALESIGQCLQQLQVPQDKITISNKLGWKRVPLHTPEPTFEPGAWVDIKHDAEQTISYEGILQCFEQGNTLLNGYRSTIVSVHDPDEYIGSAQTSGDHLKRKANVLDAYQALRELKAAGQVSSIGIGAKDIDVIDFVTDQLQLDWVMLANSLTPYTHSPAVRNLLDKLREQGVAVINSAVFNAGFLVGGDFLNYQRVTPDTHAQAFAWRKQFTRLCADFDLSPALVCVQFSFLFDGVDSVALNTSAPDRIAKNIQLVKGKVPVEFWRVLRKHNLISIETD